MTTSTEKYTKELIFALRMRDVPGDRIGEVVAEVESHITETGEDPVEAFGPSREYAAAIAPGRRRFFTVPSLGSVAIGGLAGWFLAQSVFALFGGDDAFYGIPIGLGVAIALLLSGGMVWWVSRISDEIVDPRTGNPLFASGARATVVFLGLLVAFAAAIAGILRVAG